MSDDAPRLYLITPPVAEPSAFAPVFEAALDAADIACVLIRVNARDEGTAKKIIRALGPLAQSHGAACLVMNYPKLAVRTDADGVHMEPDGAALAAALESLQPGRIVGAGGLASRDEAMTAGEAGVDYLMFGGPESAEPHAGIVERVAWWAEIFNVPCIGYAHDLDGIADLVRAGADFVALGDAVWNDPRGPAAAVTEAAAKLIQAREPAQ